MLNFLSVNCAKQATSKCQLGHRELMVNFTLFILRIDGIFKWRLFTKHTTGFTWDLTANRNLVFLEYDL